MSDERKLIRALPARSVEDLIAELAAAQVRAARGEPLSPPVVSIHLASGFHATGEIIDILFDQRRGTTLLLHLVGTSRHDRSSDVIYVRADAVAALTVHAAAGHLELLSAGQVTSPSGATPSRLETRRILERLRGQLSERLGATVSITAPVDELPAEQLQGLIELATAVFNALSTIARDDVGVDVLKTRVRQLTFGSGPGLSLALTEGALSAAAPLSERPRHDAADLQTRLEALL